jgi:Putative flagellar system-associated repeat/RTX calcium-binding nonapeptide repeat (4 copies)
MAVNGSSVSLTLGAAVASGEVVNVGYTDPTSGNDLSAIQDPSGNDLSSFSGVFASNTTTSGPDTTAPIFLSANVLGNVLTMVYNESLDPAHQPNLGNIGVSVNGTGRGASQLNVTGNTVRLTLGSDVAPGDAVTLTYRDVTGNDAYAIQDLAGNNAAAITTAVVVGNSTQTGNLTGGPNLVAASFTEPGTGTSTVSVTFNHPLTVVGNPMFALALFEPSTGGSTPITITGVAFSADRETVTYTTLSLLTATSTVILTASNPDANNHVMDDAFQWMQGGTAFIGGSGANAIDLSNFQPQYWPVTIYGNGGNDSIFSGNAGYKVVAGAGADTIGSGWAENIIRLGDSGTRATDTVKVDNAQSTLVSFDKVFGFDTTNLLGTNNDVLGLTSGVIAGNTGVVNGTDVAIGSTGLSVKSHSITAGVIGLFSDDAGATPLLVNASNLKAAVQYIAGALTLSQTVAFNFDADGNSYADSTYVFQKTDNFDVAYSDILVGLQGVVGVTLGTAAGQNVVQIADVYGPNVSMPTLISNGISLQADEVVASVANFTGMTLQHGHTNGTTQTLTNMTGVSVVVDTNDHTKVNLISSGDNTVGAGDFVLMTRNGSLGTLTDGLGHTSDQFDPSSLGAAVGGVGAHIDLSGLGGYYNIISVMGGDTVLTAAQGGSWMKSGSGNDVLTGSNASDQMRGGGGADTLFGNGGNDQLVGNAGADTLNGGAGVDQYNFSQGDSPTVLYAHSLANQAATVVTTGDTFSFAAGADVIGTGGFDVTGLNGDKINFWSDGPNITNPNPMNNGGSIPSNGQTADQQYFVVQGDYSGNTFTVNTTAGHDAMVVYDGDQSAGVLQTGLVIQGAMPSQLLQQWGQIYHV